MGGDNKFGIDGGITELIDGGITKLKDGKNIQNNNLSNEDPEVNKRVYEIIKALEGFNTIIKSKEKNKFK